MVSEKNLKSLKIKAFTIGRNKMNIEIDLNNILCNFEIKSEITSYGNGHINDTYITNAKNYILQRINTNIFKDSTSLMDNIERVTSHIRKK